MEEQWKEILNFKKYEISDLGIIRKTGNKQILNPGISSGYLRVSLINDSNERKSCRIHRLVAIAFIPNTDNKETVNHKDHNKLNNAVTNLEWASTTEQNNHKRKCNKDLLDRYGVLIKILVNELKCIRRLNLQHNGCLIINLQV